MESPWLTWNRSGSDTTCLDDLPVDVPVAPLETFRLDAPESSRRVTLRCVEDLNLKVNTEFRDVYLQEQVVAVWQQDEPWILFDSGAAAHCSPGDFTPEWPLLPFSGTAPPLKSISGQPLLLIYGRKLVQLKLDGQTCWLLFYVCDVPYSVVSVARLLMQGYGAELGKDNSYLVVAAWSQPRRCEHRIGSDANWHASQEGVRLQGLKKRRFGPRHPP